MTRAPLAAVVVVALLAPLARAGGPPRETYRQLAAVEAELDGLRRTLGQTDASIAVALEEARREVSVARRRHCQAIYRTTLLAARDALARNDRQHASTFLKEARTLLPQCPFDGGGATGTGTATGDAVASR